ncbi:hypothetical protein N0V82_006964 [Gnomoniopsis sp. IMI 355080]|nr:hypothetical protein N0V82_006964 [Gnomoniopsis sp. IMI 355080]
MPIVVKDNYDAMPLNTTSSCPAAAANNSIEDSPTVKAIQDAGAIILGKTNLHELALEVLSVSSLGGQTHNPYDPKCTSGGSSDGSGAAVAASFTVFATGTDTVHSLRNPAASNSLVTVRPTRGLITRAGVIPISFTQDTIRAMGRTVKYLARALTAMTCVVMMRETMRRATFRLVL